MTQQSKVTNHHQGNYRLAWKQPWTAQLALAFNQGTLQLAFAHCSCCKLQSSKVGSITAGVQESSAQPHQQKAAAAYTQSKRTSANPQQPWSLMYKLLQCAAACYWQQEQKQSRI